MIQYILCFWLSWAALGPVGLAISLPDLNAPIPDDVPDFTSLEQALGNAVRARGHRGARAQFHDLAEHYLEFHRVQEAIWTLHRGMYGPEAQELETGLEAFLLTARVGVPRNSRVSKIGVAQKWHLPLGQGGVSVVAKRWTEYESGTDCRMEIVAYELDRLLQLDLVPMTVKRAFRDQEFSAQYFVESAIAGGTILPLGQAGGTVTRIFLLDILLGNLDRHQLNWLYRPGGIPFAVDHDHSRLRDDALPVPSETYFENLRLEDDRDDFSLIASRLAKLDHEHLATKMNPWAKPEEVETLWKRLSALKTRFTQLGLIAL